MLWLKNNFVFLNKINTQASAETWKKKPVTTIPASAFIACYLLSISRNIKSYLLVLPSSNITRTRKKKHWVAWLITAILIVFGSLHRMSHFILSNSFTALNNTKQLCSFSLSLSSQNSYFRMGIGCRPKLNIELERIW